jgi:hypothetical protein
VAGTAGVFPATTGGVTGRGSAAATVVVAALRGSSVGGFVGITRR